MSSNRRPAFDRFVLGVALLAGAAIAVPTGSRVIAYLAGAAGLVVLHERLRQEFPPAVSALTSVLLFAGTSLFWSMTRAASPLDAITFALVSAAATVAARLTSPASRTAAWAVLAAIVISKAAAAGAYELTSVGSRATESLYSSARGWLSLTPLAYIGVIGTFLYVRRERTTAIATLAALALCVLATSIVPRQTTEPFDHGLTPALALIAPGLALAIDAARSRPVLAVAPLVAAAVLWNYLLMVQYTAGSLPKDEPVSFAAMVRQQADVLTRSPFVYPFAFPANVYFAWREGVPVDRYELLSREALEHDWDAAMDRRVDRFLLDGWGGAGSTPSGPVRWTSGRRATLAFPFLATESAATVHIVASARVEEPAVDADLAIEINGVEIGRFVAAPTPSEAIFRLPADSVRRVLRAGYNRFTIVSYGIHRADPSDQRPLGPLAARSGDIAFPVAVHWIRITSAS